MSFELDTSGYVTIVDVTTFCTPPLREETTYEWSDLSPFEQGYVRAPFREATGNGDYSTWPDARGPLGFRHLAPATLAAMMKDCAAALGDRACGYADTEQHGAMFWKDRQANQLNGVDPKFPVLTLSLGDDGLIYASEAGR